jgi:hypothetical protein
MEMWRFVVGDNAVEIENDGADYRWASLGRLAAPLERHGARGTSSFALFPVHY